MINIIEDCSPYYIRFTHDKIKETLDLAKKYFYYDFNVIPEGFTMNSMNLNQAKEFVLTSPVLQILPKINLHRCTYFISKPGFYFAPHTDGPNHTWGINYPIYINDDQCLTSWYDKEDLKNYKLVEGYSKFCKDFEKEKHIPLKSTVMQPNECVLLNTGIFHDWNNMNSNNWRVILTLRIEDHLYNKFNYNNAREIILNKRVKNFFSLLHT